MLPHRRPADPRGLRDVLPFLLQLPLHRLVRGALLFLPCADTAFRAVLFLNPFVTSYPGGWKMKMQLCAAQLMNCDVLMLNAPTGPPDVHIFKLLKDWLESFSGRIICPLHFSPFIDNMSTRIIDFQGHKLKTCKGPKGQTLTQFVDKYPEERAYCELSNEIMKLTFPEPGAIGGAWRAAARSC